MPAIRALLDKSFAESDGKDDQTMFAMSLQLEPREREDEKIARLLSESGCVVGSARAIVADPLRSFL